MGDGGGVDLDLHFIIRRRTGGHRGAQAALPGREGKVGRPVPASAAEVQFGGDGGGGGGHGRHRGGREEDGVRLHQIPEG